MHVLEQEELPAGLCAEGHVIPVNEDHVTATGRMGLRWRLGLGALCAGLLFSAPAFAEAPTQAAAQHLFEEAQTKLKGRDWMQAWELLSAAFKLDPKPEYAVNLAFLEAKLDKPRDAAEHLAFFLREATNVSPADRQRAEKKLDEAKTKIGTVTVRLATAGTEVRLDGRLLGTSPLPGPVYVEPGKRVFEARKDGAQPATEEVEVAAGSAPVVKLRVERPVEVEPGPVAGPGGQMAPATEGRSNAAIGMGVGVGLALAAVGVGATVGSFVQIQRREDELDRKSYETANTHENNRVQLANVAFYSYIGAGAFWAATAVYALASRDPARGDMPKVALTMGPSGGGLVVIGKW